MRTSKGSAILRGKVGREWSQCDGSFSKCSKTTYAGVRTPGSNDENFGARPQPPNELGLEGATKRSQVGDLENHS